MFKRQFTIDGKNSTLYASRQANRPLVLLNCYSDADGDAVVAALDKAGPPEFHLLCVAGLTWEHDMTPWASPAIAPNSPPFSGGADEYLQLVLDQILPKARELVGTPISGVDVAGYSLAGLFALYALYRCEAFDRAASVSGSLWFPNFKEFCVERAPKRPPTRLYLSLGDREAKARNPILSPVQIQTEALVEDYRRRGYDVLWELNPGNHFQDFATRVAKGVAALL